MRAITILLTGLLLAAPAFADSKGSSEPARRVFLEIGSLT